MEAKNLSRMEKEKAIASELNTEKMIRDVLVQGQQEGVFHPHDPQMGAGMIKAMLQDWYLKRSKHAKRNISVDQYADYLQNFIEAFYLKGVFHSSDNSQSITYPMMPITGHALLS
jgi:hypothetical protein